MNLEMLAIAGWRFSDKHPYSNSRIQRHTYYSFAVPGRYARLEMQKRIINKSLIQGALRHGDQYSSPHSEKTG